MTMRFEVREQFVLGKTGTGHGDDRILRTPHFTGVLDGVSGPEGSAASDCVMGVMQDMPGDASERDISRSITGAMVERFGPPKVGGRMAGVAAAILSHQLGKVFIYGDCSVVLMGERLFEAHPDPRKASWEQPLYDARRIALKLALLSGEISEDQLYDQDPGRDMLNYVRDRQHHLANVAGGYSVLCAKEVPSSMVEVVDVLPATMTLVMVTDGYPLGLMGRNDLLTVDAIEAKLAKINAKDPHCIGINRGPKGIMRNPATGKLNASFDDRAYLRIDVIRS